MHILSVPCIISTTLQRLWAQIVASTSSGLCSHLCNTSVLIFIFLYDVWSIDILWEFFLWSTTKAFDCRDVTGKFILGPNLITNWISVWLKCTQLWLFDRKTWTENKCLSKLGTIRTSSSINVPISNCPSRIVMQTFPIVLHRTVEPSARYITLCFFLYIYLGSLFWMESYARMHHNL